MNKEQLKQKVCKAIDDRKVDIRAMALDIWEEPELGYK